MMVNGNLLLVCAAALVDGNGLVLMAQRPANKNLGGLWEFPGGKIEVGETPEAALVRELYEELEIRVDPADLHPFCFASHAYERFHLLMPLYVCRTWQGNPVCKEHTALAWLAPTQMHTIALAPADVGLVAALSNGFVP